MRPSNSSLYRDTMRDLIADIRFCRRTDGTITEHDITWEAYCVAELRRLWAARHAPKVDRWGMGYTVAPTVSVTAD